MSDSTAPVSVADRAASAFEGVGEIDITKGPSGEEKLDELNQLASDVDVDDIAGETAEDEPAETGPGSASNPYTVKTLPDAHVMIKVDGEEQVVPVREMVDGYMRQDAFHKRMSQVAQLTAKAKETAERFNQEAAQFKTAFNDLIQDPDNLFDFLDEHSPEVLDAVSRKMLARVIEDRKNPQLQQQREYQRQQAKIAAERKRFEEERNAYQRSTQEKELHAKYTAEFKPGYEAGMKRAGYPEVNDEFRATVKGIVAAKREATGKLTAKDVEEAVVRAARALGAPPAQKPTAPAPKPAAKPGVPRQTAKPAQGSKSFSQLFRDLGK